MATAIPDLAWWRLIFPSKFYIHEIVLHTDDSLVGGADIWVGTNPLDIEKVGTVTSNNVVVSSKTFVVNRTATVVVIEGSNAAPIEGSNSAPTLQLLEVEVYGSGK